MIRGNHTNDYAEAGIRNIKDQVFGRLKVYNLVVCFHLLENQWKSIIKERC